MDTPTTKKEVITELGKQRRNILAAVRFYGGKANSRKLREFSDIPSGSMQHHLSTLVEWDVLRDTGETEHAGSGPPATVYELTTRGEAVVEEIPGTPVTPHDVHELTDRVAALERGFNEMQSTLDMILELLDSIDDDVLNIDEEEESL